MNPINMVFSVMLYTKNNRFGLLYFRHSSVNFNNFGQEIATELELMIISLFNLSCLFGITSGCEITKAEMTHFQCH